MSRSPDDLCPRLRGPAGMAAMYLMTQGVHVVITDTLRTKAEQTVLFAKGASKTMNSKHLAQTDCMSCRDTLNSDGGRGLSHAIDVCLVSQYSLHGPTKLLWDTADPGWEMIGKAFEKYGLQWGGRWKTLKDYAHAQLPDGALLRETKEA